MEPINRLSQNFKIIFLCTELMYLKQFVQEKNIFEKYEKSANKNIEKKKLHSNFNVLTKQEIHFIKK